MTQSLIEADGTYVQSFPDNTVIPPALMTNGRSAVPSAPDSAAQKWTGSAWSDPPAPPAPPLTAGQLTTLLIQKTIISAADVAAAVVAEAPTQTLEG